MACGISSGLSVSCEDLRKPGGVNKKLWVFNIADLRAPIGTSGYVTSLEFLTYRGLYSIDSAKFSHEATATLQKSDGGNSLVQHQLIIRAFNNDPTDDEFLESLQTADLGAIVYTNNGELLIYGYANGLSTPQGDGGTIGTGRQLQDSTAAQITLVGVERKLPRRFLRTDLTTSLTYLNSLTN